MNLNTNYKLFITTMILVLVALPSYAKNSSREPQGSNNIHPNNALFENSKKHLGQKKSKRNKKTKPHQSRGQQQKHANKSHGKQYRYGQYNHHYPQANRHYPPQQYHPAAHYSAQTANHFYDYARVTATTAIIETIEYRSPSQCSQPAHINHNRASAAPVIIGGIMGAALGNSLGHKKINRQIGTIVGGVLGAAIGHDIAGNQQRGTANCDNQYNVEYREQVVGFEVSYRYRGINYHTRTDQHPGRRIAITRHHTPYYS